MSLYTMEVPTGDGTTKSGVGVKPEERAQLESMASSRSLTAGLVTRIRTVLLTRRKDEPTDCPAIGMSNATVGKWRQRLVEQGVADYVTSYAQASATSAMSEWPSSCAKHWKRIRKAARLECTQIAANPAFELHRAPVLASLRAPTAPTAPLQAPTDPFFGRRCATSWNCTCIPRKTGWSCCGQKAKLQRWNTPSPCYPSGWGTAKTSPTILSVQGTTTLFAALDTAKGTVLTRCRQRHRHQEYLDFLRQIDNNVPPDLDVHVIVDNYATHKHPRVKRWLATRPRFHVHFTPTYASWLNQVEIWFNRITQRAIRRGTFRSVKELVTKIDQFVENDNQNAQPFVWTATADSIFAKVQRLCERISGTGH